MDPTPPLDLLISADQIAEKVRAIANQLNQQYRGKELLLIMVLKGSVCLVADLMRYLTVPFTLEFVRCSSYGQRGIHRGELVIRGFEDLPSITDKDVVVIDDICESGATLEALVAKLGALKPRSLKTLVLLLKKTLEPSLFIPDEALFQIGEQDFVVGYGLDYKEIWRGLPGIYKWRET